MDQIEIKNLTFKYAMADSSCLKNVSLNIENGDFVVVCGKSGCGKTTLLRCLKSVLTPNGDKAGEVLFENKKIEEVDERTQTMKIGFVMQNPQQQIVTDKVWHELAFGLENMGMAREEIGARIGETAEYFGIAKLYERTTNSLSGGQKQLLNLAAVMTMQPKVIILDEPTAQLDPIAAEKFIQMLHKINDELGTTVIISEHRLDQLLPVCSKAVVMKNGEILADDNSYKVADKLYNTEEFQFMPIPAQIYKESGELSENIPLTVGQGRKWIENYVNQNQIIKENIAKQNRLINLEYENKDKNKSAKDIAISGKNIWFRYERDGADIIKGISVNIENEQIYCILGGNGAGKSTTMNIITGYIAPTSGEVLVNGIDVNEEPEKAKKHIGYLPEIPPLYPDLRVREYLTFVAELKKVERAKRDVTVHKIMGRTGTLDVSERLIKNLSKGYKQRVGLAAAMLGDPEILILDEPTVGLDPKQIIEMRELIRDLSHHHTILLSSHIMQEISAVCDEIIVINEGHMIAKDTPDNLTREMVEKNGIHLVAKGTKDKIKTALRTVPGIRDVKYDTKNEEGTLGLTLYMTPGAEIREDIFYAMVKADCPIYELHPLAASLEDAFLALTRGGSRQYGGKKTKKQAAKAEETAQEAQTQTVESASATQEQQKEEE